MAGELTMATLIEQITEVYETIRSRELVYAEWVRKGRVSQAEADRRIRIMRAVLKTLESVQRRQEPSLFDVF